MKIIQVTGLADGRQTPVDGTFLVNCDVEAREGRGTVLTTVDRAKARRFSDLAAAHAYWVRRSVSVPTRPDGKPNRPLTAYTIEVIDE